MDHNKLWVISEIPDEKILEISTQCGISPLLAKIFLSRGIEDKEYIKKFLYPSLGGLYDPFLLKDMEKAVERIISAVKNNEKIVIYGDYDVDGVTSTSILYDFLKKQGANVDYYIPDRIEEGYGLSIGAVDKVISEGAFLIITVDCGITAIDEVRYIVDSNVDVIITDHHECKEILPEAYALINPCRPNCTYPFKELAGVGVVYKLIQALSRKTGLKVDPMEYLDLVTLGTVADVVSLLDENRVIAKYGISKIENTVNPGLKALINVSGIQDKPVTSYSIGFVIAPRINAAGRIGDASRAVRLLTTDDEDEALKIAKELDEQNLCRQETERKIFEQVVENIDMYVDVEKDKVFVVWGEGWHHGIIGIVASKILESYNRPCILISVEDGTGKGSGRSIEGFNLFKALVHCETLLERFGGHELAAGLMLKEENIEEFKRTINAYADQVLNDSDLVPRVKIDIEVSKEDISLKSVRELDMLAPFGADNPSPVFAYRNLRVHEIRAVGNDKHLKLRFQDDKAYIDAIGFNKSYLTEVFCESDVIDAACSLEINSWNNRESVQLNIKDLRVNEDIAIQNRFFYSLNNSIDFRYKYDDNKVNAFLKKIAVIDLEKVIEEETIDRKTAILVNSIEDMKSLVSIFEKQNIKYRVCYNEAGIDKCSKICIVVNPCPGKIADECFDNVVLYGKWIYRDYLFSVVEKTNVDKIFILDKICFDFDEDDIIIERQDLVAVYQYIRANFKRDFVIEDLFLFSKVVSKSYKIKMNYFKVKRIMDIFEELHLLKKSERGKCGMAISMIDTGGKKTNLESSDMFQSFKLLKERVSKAM